MLRSNRELFALLGIRLEEARRNALIMVAAVGGLATTLIVMGFLTRQTIMTAGGVVVALLASVLYFYPFFEMSSRFKRLEGELLPAALYAAMYASAERDMLEGFYNVEPHVAPNMAAFVKNVEKLRIKRLLATSHEAMGEAARLLEGSRLSGILGAVSIARTIGLSQYIQARDILKSVLFELKTTYARLADNVKLLGEVILVFYGVLPLMMFIMTSIFYSAGAAFQLHAYIFLVIPMMGAALAFLIDSAYPKTPESFLDKYLMYGLGAAVGTAAGLAVWFVLSFISINIKVPVSDLSILNQIKEAFTVALALATGIAVAGGFVLPRYILDTRRRWGIITALPFFVRDLAESVKIGMSPAHAVTLFTQRKSYNKYFDEVLRSLTRRIARGTTFFEAVAEESKNVPWMAAVVLTAAGHADRLGARHEVFADLADTVRDLVDIIKDARSALRGAVAFGLITVGIITVLLGVVVKLLIFQVAEYGSSFEKQSITNIQLISWSQVPDVLKYALVGAVINAAVLGILIGKMSDGNFFASSLYVTIAALVVLGILIFSLFV